MEPLVLTKLERAMVILLANGRTVNEIAAELSLDSHAVKHGIEACRTKLGARNNAQLVAAAIGIEPKSATEEP